MTRPCVECGQGFTHSGRGRPFLRCPKCRVPKPPTDLPDPPWVTALRDAIRVRAADAIDSDDDLRVT